MVEHGCIAILASSFFVGVVPNSFSTSISKSPSTRPSSCGVGSSEDTEAGLNNFLEMPGVFMSSSSRIRSFDGVSTYFERLMGVSEGIGSGLRFLG